MTYSPTDPWLLAFLRRVGTRPGMFLGDENVRTLATSIHAYGQARIDLGIPDFVGAEANLLPEFEKWLAAKLNDTRDVAWPTLIAAEDPSERNVQRFFVRLAEFLHEKGDRLGLPEGGTWPPRS
jgi:hypothetical protein